MSRWLQPKDRNDHSVDEISPTVLVAKGVLKRLVSGVAPQVRGGDRVRLKVGVGLALWGCAALSGSERGWT